MASQQGSKQKGKGSRQKGEGSQQEGEGSQQEGEGSQQKEGSQPKGGSSQGSCKSSQLDPEKFRDIINPIRDLAKNFNVNLADKLKEYLEEVDSLNDDEYAGEVAINFTEAAMLLQNSTSIFGRKVEYLYRITYDLLDVLQNNKDKVSSKGSKEKDVMIPGRHNNDQFVALDNIPYKPGSDLLNENFETVCSRYNATKIGLTPLALIPLDDQEKGNITLKTVKGEVIGNKRDFQMNLCHIDNSGCLYLPTLSFNYFEDDIPKTPRNVTISRLDFSCMDSFIANDSEPSATQDVQHNVDDDDVQPDCTPDFCINDDPLGSPPRSPTATRRMSPVPPPDFDVEDTVAQNSGQPRRRSARISKIQAQKLAQAQQKEKPKEKAKVDPWSTNVDLPDVKGPIKKDCIVKVARKLTRKSKKPDETEVVKSGSDLCEQQLYYAIDSKCLKKMCVGMTNGGVNDAFEHIVAQCYKDEQKMVQKFRKRLQTNAQQAVQVQDREMEALEGSDNDDSPVDISPVDMDSPGQIALDFACGTPDCGSSPNGPAASSEEEPHTFEDLLRAHVDDYMKDAEKYSHTTELSEKVRAWEEKITPILEEESHRTVFDIHDYGTVIMDQFGDNNRKQSVAFASVCRGQERYEVCRLFLASLVLANSSNVEISSTVMPNGLHDVNLTLLSRKRHQEDLDAFGHSSGEHE